MVVLIIGGSGSGKSAYAESVSLALRQEEPFYYLATMQIYDAEGESKVERHRRLRAGKGFETVECPRKIAGAANQMRENGSALLECMSNLVANEMFQEEKMLSVEETVSKVLKEIDYLKRHCRNLVIVSNNVFEDGIEYDPSTKLYIEALGQINAGIAAMADVVTEVVVGIPIRIKGKVI